MIAWKPLSPGDDLEEGHVHLWRVALDVSYTQLCRLRDLLAEDELFRLERFKFSDLQRRYAAARGALRAILGGYLSTGSVPLKFGYTARGKPFLLNTADHIEFNLSHSGDLMVAAFCRVWPIGVDIEEEDRRLPAREIAERFFCSHEKEEIARQDGEIARVATFFQIWTAKEAVLKASSLGIALELSKIEIGLRPLRILALEDEAQSQSGKWDLFAFRPNQHYWGTLAVAGHPSQMHYRDFVLPS
jgi:4'-phosphopantetheinyl transferase